MDKYFNEMIKLILNKKYKEAYELGNEMYDVFKTKCKNREYTNIEMANNDWRRLYIYRETANSLYRRQMYEETKMFEEACNRIVETVRKFCSDIS